MSTGESFGKDQLNDFIENAVRCKCPFETLLSQINDRTKFISEYDKVYIEKKYCDLLIDLWLREVPELIELTKPNDIVKGINSIKSVQHFDECSKITNKSQYNDLICHFSRRSKILKNLENRCIASLKKACFNKISQHADFLKCEQSFFEHIIELLKLHPDPNELCSKIHLTDVLNDPGESSFKQFLIKLQNQKTDDRQILALQHYVRALLNLNHYFLLADLLKIIKCYLQGASITQLVVDGRDILEVSGKHIVLSKLKSKVEKYPNFSKIDEVRFVKADAIHIDVNLECSVWHGKNIVLYTSSIIVNKSEHLFWNISGLDGNRRTDIRTLVPHSSRDINLSGNPGESGGNVMIIAENVYNGQFLKIISNGGNGTNGMDGVRGQDGKDGSSISNTEFINEFPPVSKLSNAEKQSRLKTTYTNVLKRLKYVEECYIGNLHYEKIDNSLFKKLLDNHITEMGNIYFEAIMTNDCKVTFSFYNSGLFTFCQSFFMFNGSPSSEGTSGTKGGDGGNCGFAGDINIHIKQNDTPSIIASSNDGVPGKRGTPGVNGKCGKYGLDKAYIDHTNIITEQWPELFLPTNNDSYSLEATYKRVKEGKCVYTFHNNMYVTIARCNKNTRYKFISSKTYSEQGSSWQHSSNTNRKKTICLKSIVEKYGSLSSMGLNDECDFTIDTFKDILKDITTDAVEVEEVVEEISVKRIVNSASRLKSHIFEYRDWFKQKIIPTYNETKPLKKTQVCAAELIKLIEESPTDICLWLNIFKAELDFETMCNMWTTADRLFIEQNINIIQIQEVKELLIGKLKLMTLEFVNSKIPIYSKSGRSKMKPSLEVRNVLSLTSSACQAAVQFLCEDTHEMRMEVRDLCEKSHHEFYFVEALKTFIVEYSESFEEYEEILQLLKKKMLFHQHKQYQLELKLLPIKNMLTSSRHLFQDNISELLKKNAYGDTNSQICLDKAIYSSDDQFLKHCYRIYCTEVRTHFDWNDLEDIKNKLKCLFLKHVENFGPLMKSYRDFLAYYLGVNILIYVPVESEARIVLVDDHNSKGTKTIHFLKKDKTFLFLDLDNEDNKNKAHLEIDEIRNKIIMNVDSFDDVKEFIGFKTNCPFMSADFQIQNKSAALKMEVKNILAQNFSLQALKCMFSADESAVILNKWIDKLALCYVGNSSILHFMILHFNTEGKLISAIELSFVLSFLMKLSFESSNLLTKLSWIIASCPQNVWLVEIALLNIDLFFGQTITPDEMCKWRDYLNGLDDKTTLMLLLEKLNLENDSGISVNITSKWIEEILFLSSNIPKSHIGLGDIDLCEWKYYLKDKFWASQLLKVTDWSENDLKCVCYFMLSLENLLNMNMCMKIVDAVRKHKNISLSDKIEIKDTLRALCSGEITVGEKLIGNLSSMSICHWKSVLKNHQNPGKERKTPQIINMIKESGNTSEFIFNILPDVAIAVDLTKKIEKKLREKITTKDDLNNWIKHLISLIPSTSDHSGSLFKKFGSVIDKFNFNSQKLMKSIELLIKQSFEGSIKSSVLPHSNSNAIVSIDFPKTEIFEYMLVATVFVAIDLVLKIQLRDTQLITILIFLTTNSSILGQVSTGEGKSIIIVAVTIISALLQGFQVDIITSSHVLAERDAKKYNELYKTFNLSAGHNSYSDMEERKKNYSNCQIVYGELASFQRDFLLDRFYSKNIMGDRKLKLIIVDEVDSMLLDQSSNMLYLSHDIPDVDKLQPVFVFIWKMLNLPERISCQVPTAQDINETVLFDIFGCINKNCIKTLDSNFTDQQVQSTWEYLIDEGVLSQHGEFLVNKIEEAIFETLPVPTCISEDHLRFLMKKIVSRQKEIIIPNHLKSFVKSHLELWIQSAMRAKSMENNKHYVVDIDRSSYRQDCNPNIVIIDHDTGNDLVNSQWDEGLHQFLQLKHGCKLSLLSLKAVFISNVSYIKLYSKLNGLSGTLGSQSERQLLKEVYDVEFVTIPTANPKIFIEYPPMVCPNSRIWLNTIIKEVTRLLPRRSALIICESVSDVNLLEDEFKKSFTATEEFARVVSSYKRDYQVLGGEGNLKPGLIILSTNLAGRGTDIKPSEDLIKAGGLHVCLSFLPSNCRIEEQAFGRVARNGVPGTAQLIFKNPIQSSSISVIIDIKKQRDCLENLRIQEIKTYYATKIKYEEDNFNVFKKEYDQLKSKMSHHEEEVKSILLKECLDQWAFWLDCNSNQLNKVPIQDFLLNLSNIGVKDELTWYLEVKNPSNLLKLGLSYLQNNDLYYALLFFDKVLANEPDFSGIARYYGVVARFKDASTILDKESVIFELLGAKKQFQAQIDSLLVDINVVENLRIHTRGILQYEFFKEQQESIIKMYMIHIQAIDIILGANADYTLMGYENILIDLTKKGVILKYKPCSLITEENLFFVMKYGLDPKKMSFFLEGHLEAKFDFKSLVDTFPLPSRELFWDQLLANKILIDETKYIFFYFDGLKKVDPSLERKLRQLQINDKQGMESTSNQIWIYQNHELPTKFSKTAFRVDFLQENTGVGLERLKFLEEREVIVYNRKATLKLHSLNQVTLPFDTICCETFRSICVNPKLANEILDELKLMGILTEKLVANKRVYSLAIKKINDLEDMQLVRFQGYTEDVKWLLNYHSSFRLALEDVIQKSTSGKHVTLHLDINPHKRLEYDLVDNYIIKTVVSNQPYDKIFEKLFSKTDVVSWGELFEKVYKMSEVFEIILALVNIKVLIPIDDNNTHYKINTNDEGKIIWPDVNKPHIINEENETIQLILEEYLNVPKEFIKQRLEESRGLIDHSDLSFFFTPLIDCLKDLECPTTEIALMSLNGFDQVLNFGKKKWTWNMITNVAIVSMLAIGQIGAGIALSYFALTPILGEKLANEGVTDLLFCVTCITTGFFSWKHYLINKSVGIALSSVRMLLRPIANLFKSKEASEIIESTLNSKTKSTTNGLIGISTKEVIKGLSVNVAKSLSIGVACNSLPHLIEPQCRKISIFLIEMFKSGIDETFEIHPINECINRMCTLLGEEECKNIIRNKLNETISECHSHSNSLLSVTVTSINTTLSEALSITLSVFSKQDSIETMASLCKLAFSLTDLIKSAKEGKFKELYNITGMLVNRLHDKLVMELSATHSDTNTVSSDDTSKYQSSQTKISSQTILFLTKIVKTDLVNYLHDTVVFPFITSAGVMISKHYGATFLRGIDLDKHLKLNRYDYSTQIFKNEELDSSIRLNQEVVEKDVDSKESTIGYKFLELEYDNILMMIFKKNRNLQLFAEIIQKNVVPDENVFRMFCVIIPDVLSITGVNIPALEIVTYHCGTCEKFTAIKNESSLTTVNIFSDDSIHVQDVLEATCKTITETCPRFKWNASEMLQHILRYIENYSTKCKVKHSNVLLFDQKQKIDKSLVQLTVSKGARDYKQLHPKGRWDFNPVLDVDLREEDTCTYVSTRSTSPVSLLTGFNIALTKINDHIYKHQNHLRPPFKLSLEQFNVLDVTITTPTTSNPKTPFQCQPVHYELIMPFTVKDGTKLEDFKISLKLNCNKKHAQPYSPQGAYIVYEIEPVHIRSDTFTIGVKGHILLSKKIISLEYTTEDSYAAGELILRSNSTISDDLTALIDLVDSKKYKVPSKSKLRRQRKKKKIKGSHF